MLASVACATVADARPRHHRTVAHRTPAAQTFTNPFMQPFSLGAFAGASGSSLIATARSYSGRNPTSRGSQWCGEFLGLVVRQSGGRVPEGYAKASNWAALPRTSEHPGAVAVMPHHVGIVTGTCENGGVAIVSGNFGRAKVGEGCISRRQIIAFVQP